jgi:hypothetical protein
MRLALAFLVAPVAAAADNNPATFSLPVGCSAYMTVQNANCEVDHHFTCTSDPAGHQQRASLDEQGMNFLSVVDQEAQWISSFDPVIGYSEWLLPEKEDAVSFSGLVATGVDTFDFHTDTDMFGTTRFVGTDRLTGQEITIDGVTLLQTSYEIMAVAADGTVDWSARGNEFISTEWNIFFGGTGVRSFSDGEESYDERPVEFIFPGEPGFLSTRPKHGCGVAISSAPLSEETTYDHI